MTVNFKQAYVASLTAAIVITAVPMIWLYGARSIIDKNRPSTLDTLLKNYNYCINNESTKNVDDCKKYLDQITPVSVKK